MQTKFKEIFSKKTEKFFFATMCKSRFNETMSGVVIKEKIPDIPTFELIQMPVNVGK